jgi:hypothetical protein
MPGCPCRKFNRATFICCLSTRISASSATRDRNRSLAIPKINRHKSSIGYSPGMPAGGALSDSDLFFFASRIFLSESFAEPGMGYSRPWTT